MATIWISRTVSQGPPPPSPTRVSGFHFACGATFPQLVDYLRILKSQAFELSATELDPDKASSCSHCDANPRFPSNREISSQLGHHDITQKRRTQSSSGIIYSNGVNNIRGVLCTYRNVDHTISPPPGVLNENLYPVIP